MPSGALAAPATRDWDFPRTVTGVALVVEHGTARGLGTRALLAGTGLGAADLRTVAREVTAGQELRVVRNLVGRLGAQPGDGLALGATYHLSTFGIFGYALLASRSVLDAMNLALRFIDLSHIFALPSAVLAGDRVVVSVDGAALPGDVRWFLVERDAAAIRTVLGELVPGGIPVELDVTPDLATLSFAASHLERVLPQANPQTLALCESLCRDVVDRRRGSTGIAQHVRVLVAQQLVAGAPMPVVAAELGLSERTLRRRLADAGATYQGLLDEVRSSLARELLAAGLPVEEVASRLGYAEASSFIHAHRRWTGLTPAASARA